MVDDISFLHCLEVRLVESHHLCLCHSFLFKKRTFPSIFFSEGKNLSLSIFLKQNSSRIGVGGEMGKIYHQTFLS